ncbi:hypothetical protein BO71DRAFT_398743 [Aspergillus ellipticus CBS 707.79]|uniref:Uncharacterized protein n=1 Tax=Aspergillus ellipticus CBS 707.79 TaxID=1448320 RepID=A0A319DB49_9EURO|nr:hypothetical protein BO71DRAFT_398743 [Aspergillus ellipticus CBS 707.79]
MGPTPRLAPISGLIGPPWPEMQPLVSSPLVQGNYEIRAASRGHILHDIPLPPSPLGTPYFVPYTGFQQLAPK